MAQLYTSRERPAILPGAPFQRTLADVIDQLRSTANLTERKRGELIYAVRRLAKAFGRGPEQVPAQPHIISRQRRKIEPAAVGLTSAS